MFEELAKKPVARQYAETHCYGDRGFVAIQRPMFHTRFSSAFRGLGPRGLGFDERGEG